MFTVSDLIAFYRNAANNLTNSRVITEFENSNWIPVRINDNHKIMMMYFINADTGVQVRLEDIPFDSAPKLSSDRVIPAFAVQVDENFNTCNLCLISLEKIETIECTEYVLNGVS